MRRQFGTLGRPSIPIFFKLWFGFIALLAVGMIGAMIWLAAQIVSAGPEGIGREVGRFIKGIDDGRK